MSPFVDCSVLVETLVVYKGPEEVARIIPGDAPAGPRAHSVGERSGQLGANDPTLTLVDGVSIGDVFANIEGDLPEMVGSRSGPFA